ncbi:MAG TPA: polysaccharide deacetylase family protein, partial [Steroidobacteraceae bacterium]
RGARRAAHRAAHRILHAAPLRLWRRLVPKSELGVCYHVVADGPVAHIKHYRYLDTASFAADLDYLERRFRFMTYEELCRARAAPPPTPGNSVILTFDDGFAECATVVAPLLRRRGLRCVFFVITDLIDNQVLFRESVASLCIEAIMGMPFGQVAALAEESGLGALLQADPGASLSAPTTTRPLGLAELDPQLDPRLLPLLGWLLQLPHSEEARATALLARLGIDARGYLQQVQPYLTSAQIRQLHADGFTIGAHSCSHRRLQELSPQEAEHEILESCRRIRALTGQSSVPFAFPYFGGGLDRAWLARLRAQHDFLGLFFDTNGVCADEPFVVQRVFGERFTSDRSLDAILRRAWAHPAAWRRRAPAT